MVACCETSWAELIFSQVFHFWSGSYSYFCFIVCFSRLWEDPDSLSLSSDDHKFDLVLHSYRFIIDVHNFWFLHRVISIMLSYHLYFLTSLSWSSPISQPIWRNPLWRYSSTFDNISTTLFDRWYSVNWYDCILEPFSHRGTSWAFSSPSPSLSDRRFWSGDQTHPNIHSYCLWNLGFSKWRLPYLCNYVDATLSLHPTQCPKWSCLWSCPIPWS